jgi:hypothetical protein
VVEQQRDESAAERPGRAGEENTCHGHTLSGVAAAGVDQLAAGFRYQRQGAGHGPLAPVLLSLGSGRSSARRDRRRTVTVDSVHTGLF